MKNILVLWSALITAVVALAADAVPVFNATLTVGKESRFVLLDATGKSSQWLEIGDTFDGFTLKDYDAKANALDLERDGKVTRVTLSADAAVAAGTLASTPATLADAEEVLRVMRFDEMIAKTMEQQKKAMAPMFRQMAAQMKVPEEDRDAVLALQQKIMNEVMDSVTGPEMRANVAKIFSDVYSKEELDNLGAFYATPAGQSMLTKQPQVQQKMMQVMMPRIAAIAPRMKQMSEDFMREHAAAKAAAKAAVAPQSSATPDNP